MRGLKFRKLDLHVHTPASTDFNRPTDLEDKQVAEAIVQDALGKGIEGIAITDHNSGEWIDLMKEVAELTSLVIFPGVEITAQGGAGIHILAIFDPSKGAEHIRDLLSKLDLSPEEHGRETTVVAKSPSEVIDQIWECGALPILAHVNSSHGVFEEMGGQPRIQVIQHPRLLAAEGTDYGNDEKKKRGKRVVDLLNGNDSEYRRKLAVYQASDNPAPAGTGGHGIDGIGARVSYFKMEKIDLASLRNCFEDPDVRIRHELPVPPVTYPRIKTVKISGGFLDGLDITLHEGLNTVIGSKGSGKSLLVEVLRFGLDQASSNPSILEDHGSKLEHRLKTFGTVEVGLLLETGQEVYLKRQYNPEENNPYVSGPEMEVPRLFPVLFLSQGEIIRIAENEHEQLDFIDQFFDFHSHIEIIAQLEKELKILDKQFIDSLRAFMEAEELQKKVVTKEEEIRGIDLALKNPTFEKFSKLESKQQSLQSAREYIDGLIARIEPAQKYFLDVPLPAFPASVADDPAIKRADKILNETKDRIREKFTGLEEGLKTSQKALVLEEQNALPQYKGVRDEYEALVRKMGGNYQVLAGKRTKLTRELVELSGRLAKAKELVDKAKQISEERNKRLDSLQRAYADYSEERKAKCKRFEIESAGKLKISIIESSNVDAFSNRLAQLKRGSYLRDADVEKICSSVTPREFIYDLIRYAARRESGRLKSLAEKVSVNLEWITTLANYLLDVVPLEELLEMQYKAYPQDRPDIKYIVSDNTYVPLSELSVGQKCTAMLLMALSDGTMPIVIDQPEDSLDIKSVWTDVCLKLRAGKERRQFIFTTHNSSLAVASDTDCFTVMQADASHAVVIQVGAMDHEPMGGEVLDYLEGGIETYRRKYVKYDAERRLKDSQKN